MEGDRRGKSPTVFINCPFDDKYRPLFRAICFTLIACGHLPRCALDYSDSGIVRFAQIVKLIIACDFSIHDISRVELDTGTGLPRFNMPLELGADLGLKLEGPISQRRRRILILDTEPHRYDVTLSDISGMDIEAHHNDVHLIVKQVRDWLNTNRPDGAPPTPGAVAIAHDYNAYLAKADLIARDLRLDPHDELPHADFLYVVERALPLIAAERRERRGGSS